MGARGLGLAAIVAIAVAVCAADGLAQDEPMATVAHGDPAMAAAYQKAHATLDGFLATWRRPPPGAGRFAVKVGIVDAVTPEGFLVVRPGEGRGRIVEYFWIGDLRETPGGFEGAIDNEPNDVHNVRSGQIIAFAKDEIADWTYFLEGKIVGNATTCPALAHASSAERLHMRKTYGLACP